MLWHRLLLRLSKILPLKPLLLSLPRPLPTLLLPPLRRHHPLPLVDLPAQLPSTVETSPAEPVLSQDTLFPAVSLAPLYPPTHGTMQLSAVLVLLSPDPMERPLRLW